MKTNNAANQSPKGAKQIAGAKSKTQTNMPQSLVKLATHIIFSTKHRQPLIDEFIEGRLHAYLGSVCNALESIPVKIGGYTDHVHILCLLSRKIALMDLLEEIKKRSSKWIKREGEQYANFYCRKVMVAFRLIPRKWIR